MFKKLNETHTYDGSFEGLFTILFNVFQLKTVPERICQDDLVDYNLFLHHILIETDEKKANYLKKRLISISEDVMYFVYVVYLSNHLLKEKYILDYLLDAFKYGTNINQMKHLDSVIRVQKLARSVKFEAHRLKGFIRFRVLKQDVLYAKINPDNQILALLIPHFQKRYKNEKWMIHDQTHHLLALYDTKNVFIQDDHDLKMESLINNEEEKLYQKLWKEYFQNIAIKDRKNVRCQLNFMPKRYWKNMLETGESIRDE